MSKSFPVDMSKIQKQLKWNRPDLYKEVRNMQKIFNDFLDNTLSVSTQNTSEWVVDTSQGLYVRTYIKQVDELKFLCYVNTDQENISLEVLNTKEDPHFILFSGSRFLSRETPPSEGVYHFLKFFQSLILTKDKEFGKSFWILDPTNHYEDPSELLIFLMKTSLDLYEYLERMP